MVSVFLMIYCVFIISQEGKTRLSKFYSEIEVLKQQEIIKQTYTLINKRSKDNCNFISGSEGLGGKDTKIIYRNYASIYFALIVDSSESELAILDLIHVFVECLNRLFKNVCELDLILNSELIHYLLSEIISGGMVVETNIDNILTALNEQNKLSLSYLVVMTRFFYLFTNGSEKYQLIHQCLIYWIFWIRC